MTKQSSRNQIAAHPSDARNDVIFQISLYGTDYISSFIKALSYSVIPAKAGSLES